MRKGPALDGDRRGGYHSYIPRRIRLAKSFTGSKLLREPRAQAAV